ncbi:CAunnamed protein product [Biomphalaria glabrata]|nr:CAunnamed protein product [Biomphalaria glabrata]
MPESHQYPRGILKGVAINSKGRVTPQNGPTTSVVNVATGSSSQRQMLRSLRWSASDLHNGARGTTQKMQQATSLASPASALTMPHGVNTYDMYAKFNDNELLLGDERNKRRVSENSEPGYKKHSLLLRKAFFMAARTDDRIKEWTLESYKTKMVQMLMRESELLGRRLSFSTSTTLSRRTSSIEQLPELATSSRRSSQVAKPTRRGSVFWVPPSSEHLSELERQKRRSIRTFKWYARIIRSLCGLLMDMQKLSISKTQQSAYSEFLYIIAGAKTHAGQEGQGEESQTLLFDKSWFNRNRAWSRMPEWAQSIMQQPPDERSPEQIHHLKQLLMGMRSFRENLTDVMRDKLCQVVRYTKCDKGRVVLRQNHIGFDFYFIFSGSVFIQIDIVDERTETTYTNIENVLRSGEGFGEIALLGDGRRTASVICKEPTELCQIDKTTFLEICPVLFNQQLQDKIQFAKQFALFQSWDHEVLKRLCFLSQVLDVPHSTVVEADWSTANYAYFVMKGRLSMLKEFDVTDIPDMATAHYAGSGQPVHSAQTEGSQTKKKITKFAHVGMLQTGSCTELSILSLEPPKNLSRITLISEGVKLFRVAVRTFLRLSPRKAAEEYLKKVYTPKTFPTEEELRSHYVKDLSWSQYKMHVVNMHRLQRQGQIIANIPATMKGSSGWAKWPGYVVVPKHKKVTKADKTSEDETESSYEESEYDVDTEDVTQELPVNDLPKMSDKKSSGRSSSDLDSQTFTLTNDRTLNMKPPQSSTVATWRKNLEGTKACNHIFKS